MGDVVVASAVRTAVGRIGGALKNVFEVDMAVPVLTEAIKRAGIKPEEVEEVIMAHNYRTGEVPANSARLFALRAGLPLEVPQFTITKHCGGSLRTISLAAQIIRAGDADIIMVGGIENMSRAAFLVPGIRWGIHLRHGQLIDQLVLRDLICGLTMGETAEKVAEQFNITREEQDQFALGSQQKAEAAIKQGRFKEQIIPIPLKQGPEAPVFDTDEHPRLGTTLEALTRLKPVFKKDGTVTAGNSSGMNDAAAALVLMSAEKARAVGIKPLAKIKSYASVGVDPSIMGTGPVPATRLALKKAGLALKDIDLIELNEAFASMAVYYQRELNPVPDKLNVNGGAIALGHPISATGAVITTKLLYEMKRRDVQFGLATMCIGGGQGIAVIFERDG